MSSHLSLFAIPAELRNLTYAQMVIPPNNRPIGSLSVCESLAHGCCWHDGFYRTTCAMDVNNEQPFGEGWRQHYDGPTDWTPAGLHQQVRQPTRHYTHQFAKYRCLNFSLANKQLYQEMTEYFFLHNEFEFHNSIDLLHFLQVNTPKYGHLIRRISLIIHSGHGVHHTMPYEANLLRAALMHALALLPGLPQLKTFTLRLDYHVHRKIMSRRLAQFPAAPPEIRLKYPGIWHAKSNELIPSEAIWSYNPTLHIPDFEPESYLDIDALGVDVFCEQMKQHVERAVVACNPAAHLHDRYLDQICLNADDDVLDDLVHELNTFHALLNTLSLDLGVARDWAALPEKFRARVNPTEHFAARLGDDGDDEFEPPADEGQGEDEGEGGLRELDREYSALEVELMGGLMDAMDFDFALGQAIVEATTQAAGVEAEGMGARMEVDWAGLMSEEDEDEDAIGELSSGEEGDWEMDLDMDQL